MTLRGWHWDDAPSDEAATREFRAGVVGVLAGLIVGAALMAYLLGTLLMGASS